EQADPEDEDDEDDEDDDDLDDERDEEPAPESAVTARAPTRRPAARVEEDDEEEERPRKKRRSAPARSSNKLLWVILGCAGGAVLVGGIILILVLSGPSADTKNQANQQPLGGQNVPKGPRGAEFSDHIIQRFARALEKRDYKAAYECTSTAFRARQSLEAFQKQVEDSKLLEGKLPFTTHAAGGINQQVEVDLR